MNAHAVIVDDRRDNADVLGELLSLEGASFTEVINPLKLDGVLKSLRRVDVIFLDLEMPEIDGYTVHQMLRANPRFQDVPVVAYTVHISEVNTAYQMGFHSFLGKPLDAEMFPEQFARILRGERVWAAG